MPHWNVILDLPREAAEAFGDAMLDEGALSVTVEDADHGTNEETPIFAEPGADAGLWTTCRLSILVNPDIDVAGTLGRVAANCAIAVPDFRLDPLKDADWVRLSQSQFEPIRISDHLWIVPTWHEPPDSDSINIRLDPGAAFGTGSHATTRLCLRWLEAHAHELGGQKVLDYGCGSGILAIAAMKLGAREAVGVDIDPLAVQAARQNAVANSVRVDCLPVDEAGGQVADFVLANILANPLKLLAPALAGHTRRGGRIVLAGLLDSQATELIGLYDEWFKMVIWDRGEGWSCLAGIRR